MSSLKNNMIFRLKRFIGVFLFLIIVCSFNYQNELKTKKNNKKCLCEVISVHDGDTFTAKCDNKTIKIRLYDVDCPELTQNYGQQAKMYSNSFLIGEIVDIETKGQDKYGRTIAVVKAGNRCLNDELLKNGIAWHYTFFDKSEGIELRQYWEDSCRLNHIGLWSESNPISPWEYRKQIK